MTPSLPPVFPGRDIIRRQRISPDLRRIRTSWSKSLISRIKPHSKTTTQTTTTTAKPNEGTTWPPLSTPKPAPFDQPTNQTPPQKPPPSHGDLPSRRPLRAFRRAALPCEHSAFSFLKRPPRQHRPAAFLLPAQPSNYPRQPRPRIFSDATLS